MNQQTLQFIQINPDDFKSEIVNSILQVIAKPKEEEILLTQQEVADFYKVSKATIIKWQKEGKIKAYAIDNERRYKKSELIDALVQIKSKTTD